MDGNVNVLKPGNQINDTHANAPHSRSRFNNSYSLAATARFGELTPHLMMPVVPNDSHSVRSSHSLRTFTLGAPLQEPIRMNKDYFNVPMQSILPLQWERIVAQPNLGDDVPQDAWTSVRLYELYKELLEGERNWLLNDDPPTKLIPSYIGVLFTHLIHAEMLYSSGSLLNLLGCSFVSNFVYVDSDGPTVNGTYDFDWYFDKTIDYIKSCVKEIRFRDYFDSSAPTYIYNSNIASVEVHNNSQRYVTMHRFLEILRDNAGAILIDRVVFNDDVTFADFRSAILSDFTRASFVDVNYTDENNRYTDLGPLFAYQIVASHFYSNDRVDFVYSADMYRNTVRSTLERIITQTGLLTTFDWNGTALPYDYCSAYYFEQMLAWYSGQNADLMYISAYLSLIFPFRHSLRYLDYFTGSKSRPLAVGDVNVAVMDSSVNVIDVTRRIQMQRFLNAVNRSGRKIANYVKEFFGVQMSVDYHDPIYLGHTMDVINPQEIQNTSDAQVSQENSITSMLRGGSSDFAFEFSCDRPGYVIGITYFDIRRLYTRSTDRHFMHIDRFDMFNPYMENTGDQRVLSREINSLYDSNFLQGEETFAYHTKYMEYKQRVSRAVGGFVHNLKGFAFLADNQIGLPDSDHISPEYIRSSNVELDPFYLSLTGDSLGSYFHFIINYDNVVDSSRPMQYNPNIL